MCTLDCMSISHEKKVELSIDYLKHILDLKESVINYELLVSDIVEIVIDKTSLLDEKKKQKILMNIQQNSFLENIMQPIIKGFNYSIVNRIKSLIDEFIDLEIEDCIGL